MAALVICLVGGCTCCRVRNKRRLARNKAREILEQRQLGEVDANTSLSQVRLTPGGGHLALSSSSSSRLGPSTGEDVDETTTDYDEAYADEVEVNDAFGLQGDDVASAVDQSAALTPVLPRSSSAALAVVHEVVEDQQDQEEEEDILVVLPRRNRLSTIADSYQEVDDQESSEDNDDDFGDVALGGPEPHQALEDDQNEEPRDNSNANHP